MKDFNSILKGKFKDKKFENQYHRIATFYRLADELLLLRKKRGFSQKELAEKAGTTQAVVSRLENASVKASLDSVVNFAEALDAFVDVKLIPLEDKHPKIEEKNMQAGEKSQSLFGPYWIQLKKISADKEESYANNRNTEKFTNRTWGK